jgi:hypothetical protein
MESHSLNANVSSNPDKRGSFNHVDDPDAEAATALPGLVGDVPALTEAEHKRLLRKMDVRLVSMVTCLYLLSFLDRGNIGNAKLGGLETDLNLKNNQYNLCVTRNVSYPPS